MSGDVNRSRFALGSRVLERIGAGDAVALTVEGRLIASNGQTSVILPLDELPSIQDKKYLLSLVIGAQSDILSRYLEKEAAQAPASTRSPLQVVSQP